jgi:streptogramin lyase
MRTRVTGLGGLLVVMACNGGGGAETETSGTTGGSTGGTTIVDATSGTTAEAPTTGVVDPGTSTTEAGTTTGTTEAAPGSSSGSGEESGTTGAGIDCAALSDGPWEPVLFASGFDGSEDLAFDGQGGLALKRDGGVVVIDADLGETVLAPAVPTAYGSRYLADGRLLVALPQGGKVIAIDGQGAIADFVTQVQGPNGIFNDVAGNTWITEFGGSRVIRVGSELEQTTIVMGSDAAAANGVVFDPVRGLLFYTKYQAGEIRRVAIDDQGGAGPSELIVTIPGTAPDGLAMDACGYLYVVDQGNSALYRVLLDAAGEAPDVGAPLATFASNVANAQFGVGPGFDPRTLYLAGNPGDVYALAVEFPGAPIAVP